MEFILFENLPASINNQIDQYGFEILIWNLSKKSRKNYRYTLKNN
jgi:hypothetical protein